MEGKKEILEHHRCVIEFVQALKDLTEDEWRTPIAENKWTVAEVISHLIPWDEFVLYKRIPYLFTDDKLPKSPEAAIINAKAALKARKTEKKIIIDKFILGRSNLLKAIDIIPEHHWKNELTIGQTRLSLLDYLGGLAEHDFHHFEQVKDVLKS
ncbi:DinB family protein [Oceanobacillus jeddahense]|uniref:DinB family protein n=1 Tax=Oceanobacillus jeddahense TaxID=1462527 RepID=UPI0006944075|nr:DinB family protein [Oceanobacillus jeddahense]